MAYTSMNQTNLANYIKTVWVKEVQMAVEEEFVFANLVDRHYEKYATPGVRTIVQPLMATLTAAAFAGGTNIAWTNTTQGALNISIDQQYYVAFGVDDFTQIQDYVGYFQQARHKTAYALAHQIDLSLAVLVPAFNTSNDVGTQGDPLTSDTLIDAYTKLNVANAPSNNRSWAFDPESIQDLMKSDMFIRMDYTPGSVSANGFLGRQIFGAPVYMSTNVDATGAYHNACYMQKEALALAMQMQPTARIERYLPELSDIVVVEAMWGVLEMRDTYGCQINTRS